MGLIAPRKWQEPSAHTSTMSFFHELGPRWLSMCTGQRFQGFEQSIWQSIWHHGIVAAVPCQHQGLLNCISHQAAVPLISDLTECRLACAFQKPNKQSWSTRNFSHIWVWSLEVLIPGSNGPVVKLEGSRLRKRGIKLRLNWQELKASRRPCLPKAPLSNHTLKVSKLLLLFFCVCVFFWYIWEISPRCLCLNAKTLPGISYMLIP